MEKFCPFLSVGDNRVPKGRECHHEDCKFWMFAGCAIVVAQQTASKNKDRLDAIMRHFNLQIPN